jgi:DNA invertase Pin-like site-specific DNA recombinase
MATVGYRRVSSKDQCIDRQLDGLALDKCFDDKVSGSTVNRPGWQACRDYLREGDTLVVHSIDRLARNMADLQAIVTDLTGNGIAVRFEKQALSFGAGGSDPTSKLLLHVLGAFAEFERELIRERQREGIDKAKASGKHCGRPPVFAPEQVQQIQKRRSQGETVTAIAKAFGVSRQTIYGALKAA